MAASPKKFGTTAVGAIMVATDPNGNVDGPEGMLAVARDTGVLYQNTTAGSPGFGSTWTVVTFTSGALDGSGTANKVAKFSDANTLTDSSITDTGALVTVTGPLKVTTDFELDGAINHDGTTAGFYGAAPAAQPAAQADASGGATIDAEARTALNGLLAKLRTLGIIAT